MNEIEFEKWVRSLDEERFKILLVLVKDQIEKKQKIAEERAKIIRENRGD